MLKIQQWLLPVATLSLLFLSSCAEDDPNESLPPLLTVTEQNSGSSGSNITIEEGQSLTFTWDAVKRDADLETFDVDVTGVNAPTTIPTSSQGNDFPYDISNADDENYLDTLVFSNAGLNTGKTLYEFSVTDGDGGTRTVSFEVTVEAATTPLATEVTGAYYHIGGSLEGSYDLVNEAAVSASQPDSLKDMENTDLAGDVFTGSWTAANATLFVEASGFDYANATVEAAASAYQAGTPVSAVANPAANEIYVAKLRGNQGYAVIKVVDVDPSDNTCACGNNGKMTFDFKKQ